MFVCLKDPVSFEALLMLFEDSWEGHPIRRDVRPASQGLVWGPPGPPGPLALERRAWQVISEYYEQIHMKRLCELVGAGPKGPGVQGSVSWMARGQRRLALDAMGLGKCLSVDCASWHSNVRRVFKLGGFRSRAGTVVDRSRHLAEEFQGLVAVNANSVVAIVPLCHSMRRCVGECFSRNDPSSPKVARALCTHSYSTLLFYGAHCSTGAWKPTLFRKRVPQICFSKQHLHICLPCDASLESRYFERYVSLLRLVKSGIC